MMRFECSDQLYDEFKCYDLKGDFWLTLNAASIEVCPHQLDNS
jgi:hypothetical protein